MENEYLIDKEAGIAVFKGKSRAMSGPENRLVQIANDAKPLNSSEKKMQKQIKAIEKTGKIVEIPAM
jgi:hypothetical protein